MRIIGAACVLFGLVTVASACSSQSDNPANVAGGDHDSLSRPTTASAVSIKAWPDAECALHAAGSTDGALQVYADEWGVVHFSALHARINDPVTTMVMDCHDGTGKRATFSVDLTSPDTFKPIAPVPSSVGWLRAALKPVRWSRAKGHVGKKRSQGEYFTNSPNWGGVLFSAAQCVLGIGNQNPSCQPCGSGPCDIFYESLVDTYLPNIYFYPNAELGILGGIGGYFDGPNPSLLQDGSIFQNDPSGMTFSWVSFTELYSGQYNSEPGYGAPFTWFQVNAYDYMYFDTWECDSQGNPTQYGAYGCFFIEDYTSGLALNCNHPNQPIGTCGSLALANPFTGSSMEVMLEKQIGMNAQPLPQFTSFEPTYVGYSITNGSQTSYTNSDALVVNMTLTNSSDSELAGVQPDMSGETAVLTYYAHD
jgi:hypothetical protein